MTQIIHDLEQAPSATELTPLTPLTPVNPTKKPWKISTRMNRIAIVIISMTVCYAFDTLFFHHGDANCVQNSNTEFDNQDKKPLHGTIISVVNGDDDVILTPSTDGKRHYDNDNDNGGISSAPLERQDIVENNIPERISISFSAPPLWLSHPLLSQSNMISNTSIKEKNANNSSSKALSKLRWGILGPGRIAHDFTSTLLVSGCSVMAVAASHEDYYSYQTKDPTKSTGTTATATKTTTTESTPLSRAQHFANTFSIPNAYGSYQELASDPNVDIVYIATTNQNHMANSMLMLRANKNVLVEKPTAITYRDAKLMYEEAEKRGLFLMTNHWTRFFPLIRYLRRMFLSNTFTTADYNKSHVLPISSAKDELNPQIEYKFNLGKVLAMHGDFSFVAPWNASDRFLNRTLGGGVTLDVGCYLIELALLAAYDHRQSHRHNDLVVGNEKVDLGPSMSLKPSGVVATGHGFYNGIEFPVDVESSFSLRWGGGRYGIWNGDSKSTDRIGGVGARAQNKRDATTRTTSFYHKDASNVDTKAMKDFTMVASFQASFRRPSTFEVEYVFDNGRIVLHG